MRSLFLIEKYVSLMNLCRFLPVQSGALFESEKAMKVAASFNNGMQLQGSTNSDSMYPLLVCALSYRYDLWAPQNFKLSAEIRRDRFNFWPTFFRTISIFGTKFLLPEDTI